MPLRRPRKAGRRRRSFLIETASAAALMFVLTWNYFPQVGAAWTASASSSAENRERERSRYFSGCAEARAAGAAPIYRGQPGYRDAMDGDSDGIACEPYRGR